MSQDYIEITERTVSEAITAACQKLAVPSERLEYEVIDPGKAGFLGIGSRAAKIRARVKRGMGDISDIDMSAIISDVMSGKKEDKFSSGSGRNDAKKAAKNEKKAAQSAAAPAAEKAVKESSADPEKAGKPGKGEKKEKKEKKDPVRRESSEEAGKEAFRNEVFQKEDLKEKEELNPEEISDVQNVRLEEDIEEEFPRRRNRGRRDPLEKGGRERGRSGRRSRRFEKESIEEAAEGKTRTQLASRQHSVPKKRNTVPSLTDEQIEEIRKRANEFLMDVFEAMDLDAEVDSTFDRENGVLILDMKGDNMGVLIGKRGQTLDSLQYLVSLVVNKGSEGYIHVKADTENYRERRKKTLENLAKNIAAKVKRSRSSVALEPMNPYERRIIHSALQGDRYVTTYSEGEEPYRKVIVTMKEDR